MSFVGSTRVFLPRVSASRLLARNYAKHVGIINIQDEKDFKQKVLENEAPVILDFHAKWCGPCKILGPRLESVLKDYYSDVLLAKLDIDIHSDTAIDLNVASVPTIIAMKDGKETDRFVGLQEENKIQEFVKKMI